MNTTTTRLAEIGQHRAVVAGELVGQAMLALTGWMSRAARTLRTTGNQPLPAHTPR